jgi:hypothetical protein
MALGVDAVVDQQRLQNRRHREHALRPPQHRSPGARASADTHRSRCASTARASRVVAFTSTTSGMPSSAQTIHICHSERFVAHHRHIRPERPRDGEPAAHAPAGATGHVAERVFRHPPPGPGPRSTTGLVACRAALCRRHQHLSARSSQGCRRRRMCTLHSARSDSDPCSARTECASMSLLPRERWRCLCRTATVAHSSARHSASTSYSGFSSRCASCPRRRSVRRPTTTWATKLAIG